MIRTGYLNFPTEVADDLGHAYAELTEPPEYIAVKGVYLSNDAASGLRVMAVYEFEDEHLDEACSYLTGRYQEFCRAPGAEYHFEDWTDVQDLLKLVSEGVPANDVLRSISFSM